MALYLGNCESGIPSSEPAPLLSIVGAHLLLVMSTDSDSIALSILEGANYDGMCDEASIAHILAVVPIRFHPIVFH